MVDTMLERPAPGMHGRLEMAGFPEFPASCLCAAMSQAIRRETPALRHASRRSGESLVAVQFHPVAAGMSSMG